MIIYGDCLHELTEMVEDSVDFVCTDPPYGYSFMGKDWDKAVPSVEIWQECLRVLKPVAIDNAFQRGKTERLNSHPTVKPLKLMSYLITLFSCPGDTVLDPFVGSGTAVVAAKQLDRHGIGIEREAEYAEIARARLDATELVEPEENKQLELV